jgi:3-oxoacyl-[acyl-carrier protein] reductase
VELGLRGKVALVAASSAGIGRACALGLAAEGAAVACCARTAAALEETAGEIRRQTGAEVFALPTDLTRPEEIRRLVEAVAGRFGRIDILVNNAGGPKPGAFADLTEQDWQEAIPLTLLSTLRLCAAVVPRMRQQRHGRIINVMSVSVKQPLETLILSNTLRAGVAGLAKSLANELGRDGILVNTVCPGATMTERFLGVHRALAGRRGVPVEEVIAARANEVPLGRIGTPEEVANLVVFLASERASYITGCTIPVDGGFVRGLL